MEPNETDDAVHGTQANTGASGAKMWKRLPGRHPPSYSSFRLQTLWCWCRLCVFIYLFFKKKRDVKVLSVFYRPKINSLHLSNPPFITPVHSPSGHPHPSLSPHLDRPCYLPNIVRQRSGIFYWLKIKVAKSPPRSPPLLLAALKNRGKHQFLPHQWRLHNQLKKTLVWGCKSYLCLIRAFRRCMSGFNVSK